jgi:hypothetical protein
MSLDDVLRDLERRQQKRTRIAFVAAVVKKFSDDQAGQLAALIAYYAFVSLRSRPPTVAHRATTARQAGHAQLRAIA